MPIEEALRRAWVEVERMVVHGFGDAELRIARRKVQRKLQQGAPTPSALRRLRGQCVLCCVVLFSSLCQCCVALRCVVCCVVLCCVVLCCVVLCCVVPVCVSVAAPPNRLFRLVWSRLTRPIAGTAPESYALRQLSPAASGSMAS